MKIHSVGHCYYRQKLIGLTKQHVCWGRCTQMKEVGVTEVIKPNKRFTGQNKIENRNGGKISGSLSPGWLSKGWTLLDTLTLPRVAPSHVRWCLILLSWGCMTWRCRGSEETRRASRRHRGAGEPCSICLLIALFTPANDLFEDDYRSVNCSLVGT